MMRKILRTGISQKSVLYLKLMVFELLSFLLLEELLRIVRDLLGKRRYVDRGFDPTKNAKH